MSRHAFTLVETILALAITLLLGVAIAGFVRDLHDRREQIARMTEQHRAAAALIDALERDVTTCMVTGAGGEVGVQGGPTSLEMRSRGVALSLDAPDTAFRDEQVVTYRFNDGAMSLRMSRGVAGDSVDEEVVTNQIARVRFRFHGDEGWRDRFQSDQANALPAAIEVAIWFDAPTTFEDEAAPIDAEELGEGFGLPPQAFADEEREDAPELDWGEPDRVRVIATPRLIRRSEVVAGGAS